jgi:hypothetical protein
MSVREGEVPLTTMQEGRKEGFMRWAYRYLFGVGIVFGVCGTTKNDMILVLMGFMFIAIGSWGWRD